jgi:hypothetical protein
MIRERASNGNGAPADGRTPGSVARDLVDHATMIVRDEIKMGRLSARRYADHLRHDVAPRAGWLCAAAALVGLGVLAFAVAVFLGLARLIGSVAWAFAIYGAVLTVAGVVAAAVSSRPPLRDEGEEIARRFPAVRAKESLPEHLVAAQRSRPEAHREELEEARRESVVERSLPYHAAAPRPELQRSR